MMGEQAGPKQLVRDLVLAEQAGFDFAVISDHYFPWLEVQGHAPYAWSVLGAAAQATDRIPLMTYVTDRSLSPGGGGAEGGDHAAAVGRAVHPWPRRRGEPERAHRRRTLADRRCTPPDARRGGPDYPRAVGGGTVTYRGSH